MLAAHYDAYGESSVLVVDRSTIAKPSCGDHDVLISVHATAINPVDCKLRAGSITAWPSSFPCVPGWDVSGIVAEVGSKCTRFAVGDAVYAYTRPAWDMEPSDDKPGFTKEEKIDAHGTAAEFLAVKEWKVAAKPAALSFTQAACIPLVGLTAWQGLFVHGGLVAGQVRGAARRPPGAAAPSTTHPPPMPSAPPSSSPPSPFSSWGSAC
jgi:NADPH:quinone reductase-like Zn-dependent oxidoreductase